MWSCGIQRKYSRYFSLMWIWKWSPRGQRIKLKEWQQWLKMSKISVRTEHYVSHMGMTVSDMISLHLPLVWKLCHKLGTCVCRRSQSHHPSPIPVSILPFHHVSYPKPRPRLTPLSHDNLAPRMKLKWSEFWIYCGNFILSTYIGCCIFHS